MTETTEKLLRECRDNLKVHRHAGGEPDYCATCELVERIDAALSASAPDAGLIDEIAEEIVKRAQPVIAADVVPIDVILMGVVKSAMIEYAQRSAEAEPVTEMQKVDQTEFGKDKGNCQSACIAMMLGIPLSDVPNFYDISGKQDDAGIIRWNDAYDKFLAKHNVCRVAFKTFPGWQQALKGFYLMVGKSPRGEFNHIVVYKDGALWHDPHHSRDGVLDENEIEVYYPIIPIYAAPQQGVCVPLEETTDSKGDWQCKDFGDDWITFPDRKAAEQYQEQTGALMRYRRYYPAMLAAAKEQK